MTLEAFLQLPEEKPALEYEDGRITQKVSPKLKHADLQAELAALIRAFGRPRQLAMAYPELRTTFGGRSYVPDVAVFRWERIPTGPDGELVNEVFTPLKGAVDEARELVALFDEHAKRGVYAFTFKGQMVDAPHLTRARKLLARAGVE